MPSRRQFLIALTALLLAFVIGGAALILKPRGTGPIGVGEALVGGSFSLTDHNGRRVTEEDFLGKPMLVFFGYTYCPDVCPTELQVMAAALEEMDPAGMAIQPVFISIDPARDTPGTLKAYVENFGPRLMGLTGTDAEVAAAARAYRVYYKKVEGGAGGAYLMDHSSIIYLMGADGKFVKHFTYSTDAKALARGIAAALAGSS